MSDLGHFSLAISWFLALLGLICGIWAGAKRSERWFHTTRNATALSSAASLISLIALGVCFYQNDYSLQYVWQYSDRSMPDIYRLTAIWGGMDGSMLLWCAMLGVSAAIVAWQSSRHSRVLMPWVLAVLNSSALFFLTITLFYTNPFRFLHSEFIPTDGNGLNPLLQNPYMAIHPPMLYLGFTSLAVPYAFCMGALISGYLSNEWITLTRRWTISGWAFLTAGIMLGGHWAYVELGWGGFWAWDPVENASFLPWLTATAFLHSVMVQERKEMLKFWNIWLVTLSYALTVFGTFLTRSGVVQSVHAFASTDVGEVFLQYLAVILIVALILTFYRRSELKAARHIEHLLSREAAFLLNNLVLLSICFATMWGILFPILSEAVTGQKQTVGIPFFNAVNVPLFLALLFLMGIGTLIAWRKATWTNLRRTFFGPFVFSFALGLLLLWAGVRGFYPILAYSLSFFAIITVFAEFHRAVRSTQLSVQSSTLNAASTVLRRHRSRYGGYLIHIGVAIAAISITASMAHKIEREFTLKKGETIEIGRFSLSLSDFKSDRNDNFEWLTAIVPVSITASAEQYVTLFPEKRFYFRTKEPTTEVALKIGPREDLYLVIAGLSEDGGSATFKIFINPLQMWLWVGGIIMILGSVIVVLPRQFALERHAAPAAEMERG